MFSCHHQKSFISVKSVLTHWLPNMHIVVRVSRNRSTFFSHYSVLNVGFNKGVNNHLIHSQNEKVHLSFSFYQTPVTVGKYSRVKFFTEEKKKEQEENHQLFPLNM